MKNKITNFLKLALVLSISLSAGWAYSEEDSGDEAAVEESSDAGDNSDADSGNSEEAVAEAPTVRTPQPDTQPAPVASDNTTDNQMENCLDAIYMRSNTTASASDEIVVVANGFNPHFTSPTHMESSDGDLRDGTSYFLTRNHIFSADSTFHVFDSSGTGQQWKCGSVDRLRRLNDDGDDEYDSALYEHASNAERTAADLRSQDEWRGRSSANSDVEMNGVYYVKIENRHYRISCRVRAGLGAHKNQMCDGNPVNLQTASSQVKTCVKVNKPKTDFVKRSLRTKEALLRRNTPSTSSSWNSVKNNYDRIKQSCSSVVSQNNGAEDALSDLGKEINERIRSHNRKPANRSSQVTPVVVYQD